MKINPSFPDLDLGREDELFELDIEIHEGASEIALRTPEWDNTGNNKHTGVITIRDCYTRICTKQGCTR